MEFLTLCLVTFSTKTHQPQKVPLGWAVSQVRRAYGYCFSGGESGQGGSTEAFGCFEFFGEGEKEKYYAPEIENKKHSDGKVLVLIWNFLRFVPVLWMGFCGSVGYSISMGT